MIIPFVDWQPDAADFGARGSTTITNAVPGLNGFKPFPSLNILTTALTAAPRGGIEAFDKDDTSHMYVGDTTKLYELDKPNLDWTDVTRASGGNYSTGSGEVWSFVRWKNKVLATNFSDDPQQITMGGSNFTSLTTAFRARNIAVVDDFVVMSNTYDATDGNVPNRVRWSAIDDETDYTVSTSTLSNYRDLPTGGPIRKIIGGEVGVIVCERAIYRMDFVGAPAVFQTNEIQGDVGTISGGSVTSLGDSVYLISDQGFLEITGNGTGKNPIGAGRVDQWFFSEYDSEYPEKIFSMPDPTNNRILWCFPGSGSASGRPNKIVVYDKTFDKWALVEEEVEMILKSKGVAITLDELDSLGFDNLDEMTVSLDSPQFKALISQIAAFNSDKKLGFFRGIAKTATSETGETQFYPGSVANLSSFAALVDGGTVVAQVGSRMKMSDNVTWSDQLSQTSTGKFTARVPAKFHRFRFEISGTWTDAIGVEIDPQHDVKQGGKRG